MCARYTIGKVAYIRNNSLDSTICIHQHLLSTNVSEHFRFMVKENKKSFSHCTFTIPPHQLLKRTRIDIQQVNLNMQL